MYRMFKKSGFSMLEIVTVLGIMGILGFGGMKIFDSMNFFRKKGEENYEIMMLHTAMIQNFRSDKACRFTLTPLGNLNTNSTITAIRNFNNDVVFNTTNEYGNKTIKIDSMRTNNMAITTRYTTGTKSRGTLNVQITYKRISKTIKLPVNDPARYITKSIPIEFEMTTASGIIANCVTKIDNAASESASRICTSKGGLLSGTLCNLVTFPSTLADYKMVSVNYLNAYPAGVLDARYFNTNVNEATNFNLHIETLITSTNITAGVFAVSSDKRLKEKISPINGFMNEILLLSGKRYNFKKNNHEDIGLIAQEVKPYFPSVVSQDSKGYWMLAYEELIPVLLEAIKENQRKLKELRKIKHRIAVLQERLKE